MSTKLLRAVTLAAGLLAPFIVSLGTSGRAHAQEVDSEKLAAKAAYKKGTIKYNLGEWDKAISHFKAAFEAYPDASFLFNIAQSYRQADDCKQSAFFYKRYLAIKPDASNKREVEGFIRKLNATCKKRAEEAATRPVTPPPPPPDTTTTTADPSTTVPVKATTVAEADNSSTSDASLTHEPVDVSLPHRKLLVVGHLGLGPSFMTIGTLETTPQLNLTFGAGYPVRFGSIVVDGGILFSHTSVSWDAPPASDSAGFTGLLLNVGATMEVANNIRIRGEFGAGVMVYSGLDVVGNVFVEPGTKASGALASGNIRFALGGEYAITNAIAVSVQPIVVSTSPAPDGLRKGIDSVDSFQALFGLSYQM